MATTNIFVPIAPAMPTCGPIRTSEVKRHIGFSDEDGAEGTNTEEGDVMNDTHPSGGIDPRQRVRTNQ